MAITTTCITVSGEGALAGRTDGLIRGATKAAAATASSGLQAQPCWSAPCRRAPRLSTSLAARRADVAHLSSADRRRAKFLGSQGRWSSEMKHRASSMSRSPLVDGRTPRVGDRRRRPKLVAVTRHVRQSRVVDHEARMRAVVGIVISKLARGAANPEQCTGLHFLPLPKTILCAPVWKSCERHRADVGRAV